MVRQSTSGGANWSDHWNGRKGLRTRELIAAEEWDVVILQDHSQSTYDQRDSFMHYGHLLLPLVQDQGAVPLLYATWAKANEPEKLPEISEAYQELGQKTGVWVAPVGEMYKQVALKDPGIELYDADLKHPSPTGTYLAALVLYRTIIGPVADIPYRLSTKDADGEILYMAIVGQEIAQNIKEVIDAWVVTAAVKKLKDPR